MSFQNELEKSFGITDHIFGGHAIEREHAREMLKEASAQGKNKSDIDTEARKYLSSKSCQPVHIDEQIKRMNDIDNYI